MVDDKDDGDDKAKSDPLVVIAILVVMFTCVFGGMALGTWRNIMILNLIVAAVLSPVIIHGISRPLLSSMGLILVSQFAARPVRKVYEIEGFLTELSVIFAITAAMFVVGIGWRRKWS